MTFLANSSSYAPRRLVPDRRQKKASVFSRHWLNGKRALPRREEERQGFYRVDRYGGETLAPILLIIMFSLIDALFTLHLISLGAVELNPVMAYFLDHGPLVFLWAKHLLTCTALMVILVHKNAFIFKTRVRAEILFRFVPLPFALVISWQIYLISKMSLNSL